MMREIHELGLTDYQFSRDFQARIFEKVKSGSLRSALILCRHRPVITMGRQAKPENIKSSSADLDIKGIRTVFVERGGDVTYHGPGQLVIYPVCDLRFFGKDLHQYLRMLESLVMGTLTESGINPCRKPGLTGVWVDEAKISSIGIAVRNWISYHGIALNVKKDDLEGFSLIRPCGMDIRMTSMETILNRDVSFEQVSASIIRRFQKC